MQNHIKERVIGSVILLIGGVLLGGMLLRSENNTAESNTVIVSNKQIAENTTKENQKNLTVDYETEQRILAEKKEERSKQVSKREEEISVLLKEQAHARAQAFEKAKKEQKKSDDVVELVAEEKQVDSENTQILQDAKQIASKIKRLQTEKDQIRAQQVAEEQKREKQAAKNRAKLAEKQRLLAKKKTAAEKIRKAELAKKDKATRYIQAKNKLSQARKKADNNAKKYAVQIALAANQKNADSLANSLKKHGYTVSTSKTSRGVRVIVGPEEGEKTAYALRNTLQADKRINVKDAWVTAYSKVRKSTKSIEKDTAQTKKTELNRVKKSVTEPKKSPEQARTENKYNYGVQVAMAGNTQSRDDLITKLRSNGYKVKTSHTSRGTRIIVGGGMTKKDAIQLQKKVNGDKRVGISGAWLKRERR